MSGRRSQTSKSSKENKAAADQNISQQLEEINAKLAKLDSLEKLNKDLLTKLLKLSQRVDAVTVENRKLKQEVVDLKQAQLQKEVLIKGFKLEQPKQHLEAFNKVCELVGFEASKVVEEVRPLVFKQNKRTDAVLVKFWRVQDKQRFIGCVRALKRPVTLAELNIRSQNKFVLVQDHLTPEKLELHRQTWELCKLGLQRPWIYNGSTWTTHPETNKRFRVADSGDLEDLQFILVTAQQTGRKDPALSTEVIVSGN
uniref:(northern house mosquito) hypothetical protein n=1 Tax=Culex pipiens TaxID=7175 RepID=A0A8D8JRT6_CULPI